VPSLRELQQAFAAGVWHEAPAVLTHIRDATFPAARLLQIYRHNSFASLTDALAADFPVVHRLVGESFFERTTEAYLRQHPPQAANLHDVGKSFAEFLSSFEPAQTLAYLADVARLERAWHEAYHAADGAALALERLAGMAPENYGKLVLTLHPSARVLTSAYPILRIWQVNQPGYEGNATVSLDQGGVHLLVIRRSLEVEIETLTHGEHALLHACAQRQSLAIAQAAVLAYDPDFDLTAALRAHIARATLTDILL